jgi:hypothetical protein
LGATFFSIWSIFFNDPHILFFSWIFSGTSYSGSIFVVASWASVSHMLGCSKECLILESPAVYECLCWPQAH